MTEVDKSPDATIKAGSTAAGQPSPGKKEGPVGKTGNTDANRAAKPGGTTAR